MDAQKYKKLFLKNLDFRKILKINENKIVNRIFLLLFHRRGKC